MKIAYFVHDLTDPAVARRVRMLQAGGADVLLLGFRRTESAPDRLEGAEVVDLGRTYDGQLGQRARVAVRSALTAGRLRGVLFGTDVVLARTLEMLLVAHTARRLCDLRAPVVYECLDIHRLMLADAAKGRALRALERGLMRRSRLLIVSSPAFLDSYFRPRQGVGDAIRLPTLLVENKLLELDQPPSQAPRTATRGRPWRVGWLGAIRCRRSLDILTDLATRRPDLLEVRLHGRPAYSEFADFDAQVAAAPNVSFGGAYAPADLPRLYGETDFSWAVDFMEEGLNSAWLLPNRIYESSRFGVVPIALKSVETGRFLEARSFGVTLDGPEDLEGFLETMTPRAYEQLTARQARVPLDVFIADRAACRTLVQTLGALEP